MAIDCPTGSRAVDFGVSIREDSSMGGCARVPARDPVGIGVGEGGGFKVDNPFAR